MHLKRRKLDAFAIDEWRSRSAAAAIFIFEGVLFPRDLSSEEFACWKTGVVKQIDRRLAELRRREEMRRGIVSGIDIETRLGMLTMRLRPSATFPKCASFIEAELSKASMTAFCKLLDAVEEQLPWNGVDLQELFDERSRHRASAHERSR